MTNYEILKEIGNQQSIASRANARIAELLGMLQTSESEEWEWLPVRKASEYFGISVSQLYTKIDAGKLNVKVICGKKFVNKKEVESVAG